MAAVCQRFRAGEGVACRFFSMNNTYLFIGDHKYWAISSGLNLLKIASNGPLLAFLVRC